MLRVVRHHWSRLNSRSFGWTAFNPAHPATKTTRLNTQDVFTSLEETPVVRTVLRQMQHRLELQNQAVIDVASPESKQLMKKISEMEPLRLAWEEWDHTRQLLRETVPLLEDTDPAMRLLAADEYDDLLNKLNSITNETFPSILVPPSTTSHLSAMLEFKAGVGGSEAALFLAEIMRMYIRFAQTMGWQAAIVANNPTENGGVKDAIVEIKGEKAYDTLRWESGVHRVQRVPATEASGRLHTSTVAVLALPLAENNGSSEVDEELFKMDEVKIEVMRSRGAGGQHVNKTESAVRLTHIPTGITVSMQDERSQHQNRRKAFQVLRARLMYKKVTEEVAKQRDVRRNLVSSADRSEKIRTYNYPQSRVTDHRLGLSLNNLTSVMEGDGLHDFIDELARKHKGELLEEALAAL